MLIINPKRINEKIEVKPYWYNYYAGYSHTFTQNVIESAGLSQDSVIMDPWNGAGTTTLMSSVNGFRSIGVDLNPVMRVIANAKQTTKDDINLVKARLKGLSSKADIGPKDSDSLRAWFSEESIESIRKIEKSILGGKDYWSTNEKVHNLTAAECLMYTALFNCVRAYLSDFIPSNPTWIKKPKNPDDKIRVPWVQLRDQYVSYVNGMINGMSVVEHDWPSGLSEITVGSSGNLSVDSSSIDFVLTSPPYCTRIDYGVATLPELSILCVNGEDEVDKIRRKLMGTTTVPKSIENKANSLTGKCHDFLEAVRSHSSKASKTYYYKNLVQYFYDLMVSLGEIDRVLKVKAKFVCVVQDSYYKDVHCDLPGIVVEMASSRGLMLLENVEFESKRNMANMNVGAKQYRDKRTAYENVLIFEKRMMNE